MCGERIPPPTRDPPTCRVTTREKARLPHTDGEVLRVTGRSRFADQILQSPATDFSLDGDTSLRFTGGGKAKGKEKSDKRKGNPIKEKEKKTK